MNVQRNPSSTVSSPTDTSVTLPVSFDRSQFLSADYSSSTFLAARRKIPLEIIKSELNQTVKHLKLELVDLINKDYADFIHLSTRLVGLDKILTNINQPLNIFKSDVKAVEGNFQSFVSDLEKKLEERKQISEKKSILNLFVGVNESVTKVEELLENSVKENESSEDSLIDGKLIERVAIEFNQLQYLCSEGKDYPFVKNVEWRIIKIKDTLSNSLTNALKSAFTTVSLNPNDQSALDSVTQFLRTYLIVDKVKDAEEVFSQVLVLPIVKELVVKENFLADKSESFSKLELIYKKFLDYSEKNLYEVINCARKSLRGTSFDFAIDCLFKIFIDFVTRELTVIFNPGQPLKFQKNYIKTTEFLSNFEKKFFREKQQYLNFRASAVVSRKINEMFSTAGDEEKFGEINCDLGSSENGYELQLCLKNSQIFYDCVESCWSDNYFLYTLSDKFWKLTQELIGRYNLWIKQSLPTYKLDEDKSLLINEEENILVKILYLNKDLRNLKIRLLNLLKNQILLVTPANNNAELLKILEENFNQSLSEMMENLEVLNSILKNLLLKRCLDSVKLVKNIPRDFRASARELPTEASYFISQIFQPLENFRKILNEKFNENKENIHNNNGFIKEISSVLITDVSSNFIKTVKETLKQTKSIEDSFRRLKKKKNPNTGSSTENSTSFEDIVKKQMMLDVKKFCSISLTDFNINLEVNDKEYKNFFEEYNLEGSFDDVS
ncbi:Conserved oligomeric Golgi complex subunit 2 [Lobulomyces angularis]|nr:Conserved oligomeric Golgi complex subunit 2 [Lobulomyces angularis]